MVNADFEATVVTGLETMCREEVREKLGVNAECFRGRVTFTLPVERTSEIFKLQSIDNFFVVLSRFEKVAYVQDLEKDLEVIKNIVGRVHWETGLEVWRRIRSPSRTLDGILARRGVDRELLVEGDLLELPHFRVTCNRTGNGHKFSSMQAACEFGGKVNDTFHWKVDMKGFDMNIFLNICDQDMHILLALTPASLHHRHLVDFGPTTLRSTIAYNMLRLGRIQPGEVVCDPLCGGGSIPIEASLNWPSCHVICGDNHDLAVPRCNNNLNHMNQEQTKHKLFSLNVDLFSWDATNLPLKSATVDVVVTDLPFGKRMGSKFDNRRLYPALLKEMARVVVLNTGRAVLLTQDKRSLLNALHEHRCLWRQGYTSGCNVGGLNAAVFVCHRSHLSLN